MNVLSLFDGMACGMLAMQAAGITVDRYVAFEIDKYAVKTSSHNFPMIEHRGDVFKADFTEFRGFHFLIGGSPCTFWSIAQKNNRETEASGMGWELFSQFVRALHEAQPMYFIYENNKSMSKAIRESITQAFGFEPICINSALVSAQNRQRLYWVGRRNPDGTYSRVHVEQPEDRGILLRDVLDGFGAKELTEREMDYMVRSTNGKYSDRWAYLQKPLENDKALCITANVSKGVPYNICAEPVNTTEDGKAQCLRATCYKDGIRNIAGNDVDKKTGVAERLVSYDCEIPTKAVSCADGKVYPVYEVKDGQITIKGKQYPIKLQDGFYIIRKLTVSECKRLQTVPEWYEFPVSDSQAYKMLGNGWTVVVIAHLIVATQTQNDEYQLDLFGMAMAEQFE